VSWGPDDWEQYAFLPSLISSGVIESPAKALEMWTLELEAMHRLGAASWPAWGTSPRWPS
jgi:peptidoglycan-N-acetylglucosamine deacetylase